MSRGSEKPILYLITLPKMALSQPATMRAADGAKPWNYKPQKLHF